MIAGMPMKFRYIIAAWSALALIASGCTGFISADTSEVEEHGGDANDVPEAPVDPTRPLDPTHPVDPELCAETERFVAQAPARILTSDELNNALRTLFAELEIEPVSMTFDSRVGTFVLNGREAVVASHIQDFRRVAETVASDAAAQAEVVAPCENTAERDAALSCGERFVQEFGEVAFRRPLRDEEATGLAELFAIGYDESGYAEGLKYVVEATLQAPSFIYVFDEVGQSMTVSNFEIAQRMAAILWRSLPDEHLMARARAGELSDPQIRQQEAERMLQTPESQRAMRTLVMQWVGVDRLEDQAFAQQEENQELVASMLRETTAFVDEVMQGSGSYQELLDARYTFVDARMAAHYGIDVEGLEAEDGLYRVEAPERAGLLTHASFLALHHGPVHRGLTIRKTILCGLVPGPVGVDTQAIPTEPGESERSKTEKRLANQSCSGCHKMMDPLALPLETFGEVGAYRTEDKHGNPVSGAGEIFATTDIDGPVSNAVELVERLSQSDDVGSCVASHLFTWSYARVPSQEDACLVQDIGTALEAHGGDLRQALVAIIGDEGFVMRGEVQ